MKKILKNTLLGLALVPCMFATACGGNDEPTLEEKQNNAYTSLRTLVVSERLIDNTKNIAYTETASENMSMYMDYSNAGLKTETVNNIKAQFESMGMGGTVEEPLAMNYSLSESYGYKTDGTGYREYKEKDSESNEWVLEEQNVTKKVGDKYVDYQYDRNGKYNSETEEMEPTSYAYYVGSDYAKNKYTYNIYENEEFDFSGLMELIKNNDSLTKFKNNISSWAEESVAESLPSAPTDGGEGTSTTSLDLKLEKDYSVLEVTISVNDMSMENEGIAMTGDISAKLNIKFNSSGLMSIESDMDADLAGVVMDYETLSTMRTDEAELTQANNVSMNMSMDMNYTVELGTTFKDTVMNTNVSSYTGDGEEGAIQNIEVEPDLIFVNTDYTNDYYQARYDEVIDITAEELGLYDSTIALYWDEACTQAIANTEKYPTYDKNIYVKVTPNTGYAIVNELIVHDDREDDWYNDSYLFEHEIAEGNYTLSVYDYYYFDYEIVKVELNGVEVTNYAEGIELTAGTINTITIHVVTPVED